MRDRIAALIGASAVAVTVLGAITVAPPGAFAAETCTTVVHRDLSGVKIDDGIDGTTTNATTTLLDSGVEVTTPDDQSRMYARFPTEFALADVSAMSYQTYRYPASTSAVAVYEIDAYLSGHAGTSDDPLPDDWTGTNDTTLVYTPDPTAVEDGAWQTWDADDNATAAWWSTGTLSAIPGDAGPTTPETWSAILAAYPNAVGTDYGIDQGEGTTGAVTAINDVTLGTSAGCTTQAWTDIAPPAPDPAPSTDPPVGGNAGVPAPSATAPAPKTTGMDVTPPVSSPQTKSVVIAAPPSPPADAQAAGNRDAGTSAGLALTGPDFFVPASFGLLLVISGSILFAIARRRRQSLG